MRTRGGSGVPGQGRPCAEETPDQRGKHRVPVHGVALAASVPRSTPGPRSGLFQAVGVFPATRCNLLLTKTFVS